jgi:hypothetical protein
MPVVFVLAIPLILLFSYADHRSKQPSLLHAKIRFYQPGLSHLLYNTREENFLRDNPSRSYSKDEIINLLSADPSSRDKIKMEVLSSIGDIKSPSVYSSCKGGTMYFQWRQDHRVHDKA